MKQHRERSIHLGEENQTKCDSYESKSDSYQTQNSLATEENKIYGVGIDVGTGNFVSARYENDEVQTLLIRDAFTIIDADKHKLKMLKDRGEDFILKDDKIYLIGEKAKVYANIFGSKYPLRRPLAKGVLNPEEKDAHFVVREILKSLLGTPKTENEIVYFSVPAEPLDATFNQIFHENKFIALLNGLGFDGRPINEAKCVIYAEGADYGYTGIAISLGAGMANIAISFENDSSGLEFSLTKPGKDATKDESYGCGDWIDKNAALAIGKEVHEIIDIKEECDLNGKQKLNLLNPETEEHFAITVYYKNLIRYVVANIKNGIDNLKNIPRISQPIPIFITGGTSMATGFIQLFEAEWKKYKWAFEISEIKHVDPLRTVATGALVVAISEYN